MSRSMRIFLPPPLAAACAAVLAGCPLVTRGTADVTGGGDGTPDETVEGIDAADGMFDPDAAQDEMEPHDPRPDDALPGEEAGSDCEPPDPPWWDPGWNMRTRLDAEPAPPGYSYLLVLRSTTDPTSEEIVARCLPGVDDLRVAAWDGSGWTELDRRIAELEPEKVSIWLKLSDAGASHYLYWENSAAGEPPADPRNIFLWFDDFDRADGDPGIGSEYGVDGDGTWEISEGELLQTTAGGFTVIYPLAAPGWEDLEMRYLWSPGEAGCVDAGPVFGWDFSGAESTGYYLERQGARVVLFDEPAHDTIEDGPASAPAREPHVHVIEKVGTSFTFMEDRAVLLSGELPENRTGAAGLATYCTARPFRFDLLRVRMLARPESQVAAAGSEEYYSCP